MNKNTFVPSGHAPDGSRKAESAIFPFIVTIEANGLGIINNISITLISGERMPKYDVELIWLILPVKIGDDYYQWVEHA